MATVDVGSWAEFRVGDLFGPAKHKRYHNPLDLEEDPDGYEYICASQLNNGLNKDMPFVTGADLALTEPNIIAWGKQCPTFTYHAAPCVSSQGMYYITLGSLSEMTALFLIAVLTRVCDGLYNYSDCLIGSEFDDIVIKLPATPDGEPDWAFMEEYMRAVMERQAAVVDALSRMATEKRPVDVGQWVEFRVGDLFETVKDGKQVPTGSTIVMRDLEDGDVDRITVSDRGNGVTGQYAITSDKFNVYENFISVSFLGSVFYHAGKASLDMKVHCLKPLGVTLNESTGLFLASIIRKVLYGLDYTNQISSSMLPDLRIRLPATLDGEPDWAYMEEYMRAVMERQEHVVEVLSRICKH